jgi:copper(I)-binding protein
LAVPTIRLICVLLSLLAAGRAAGAVPAPSPRSPQLVVEAAWVRAPAPGTDVGAAYFTVRNTGHETATIVGICSPAAAMAMLHETSVDGGTARMRPRERLEIAPGQTIALKPGGLHVMLHGLKRTLAVGESVPLTLQLADGEELAVTAQVRPIGSQ